MNRDIERLLNLLSGAGVAAAAIYALGRYADVRLHPQKYAAQSAPWTTEVMVIGGAALVIALGAQAARLILKKKNRRAHAMSPGRRPRARIHRVQ